MVFKKQLFFIKLLVIILLIHSFNNIVVLKTNSNNQEFCEVYGEVVRVIDGDTIDIRVLETYSSKYSYLYNRVIRIRFADINAPELGTVEGEEAKNIVIKIMNQYGWFSCLNIDDYGEPTDHYGRYIALIYVKYNSTHWLNLNKWLIEHKYAEIMDFTDNEFNPNNWVLYVAITTTLSTQHISSRESNEWLKLFPNISIAILAIVIIVIVILSIKYIFISRNK